MDEMSIKHFVLNICEEDVRRYKYGKNVSYIIQNFIITTKSLMPLNNKVGNSINYKRFNEELKLWYYYKNGSNASLINSINCFDNNIYWNEFDDSVYIRILPIIFSNEDWEIIKDEIVKSTLFTTGNISTLLEAVLLGKIVCLILKEEDLENIIDKLKIEIINFSQTELDKKYSNYYRSNISTYSGSYKIDFERNKIKILNILNRKNEDSYKTLKESLYIIEGNEIKKDYSLFSYGLYSMINNICNNYSFENRQFVESLCTYLYKLRKGRIPPEDLKIHKYYLPNIFEFEKGDKFYHSLLNNCFVIDKVEDNDSVVSYVQAKTCIYKFNKRKGPHVY